MRILSEIQETRHSRWASRWLLRWQVSRLLAGAKRRHHRPLIRSSKIHSRIHNSNIRNSKILSSSIRNSKILSSSIRSSNIRSSPLHSSNNIHSSLIRPQQPYPPQQSYPPPPSFPPQELDRVVSRIALYPDPLLSQILAAATFPDQIQPAAQWADQHHYLTGPALAAAISADHLPWDPSVQALLPFPSVLEMMASDMSWTSELGNAFLAQQPDVMDAVQRERHQAYDYGYLRTNPQIVVNPGPYIEILPANPAFIVVPYYNPLIVFAPPRPGFFVGGAIGFGYGITIGAAFGPWGWGSSRVAMGPACGADQQCALESHLGESRGLRASLRDAALYRSTARGAASVARTLGTRAPGRPHRTGAGRRTPVRQPGPCWLAADGATFALKRLSWADKLCGTMNNQRNLREFCRRYFEGGGVIYRTGRLPARHVLNQIASSDPAIFFAAAIHVVASSKPSEGSRHLVLLLAKDKRLSIGLLDPEVCTLPPKLWRSRARRAEAGAQLQATL